MSMPFIGMLYFMLLLLIYVIYYNSEYPIVAPKLVLLLCDVFTLFNCGYYIGLAAFLLLNNGGLF